MINPAKIKIISTAIITAVKGVELNIYKTNFLRNLFKKYNDNIEFNANIDNTEITVKDEMITLNALTSKDVATTINLYNNYGLEIQSKSVTLNIIADTAPSSVKNILMVGDSITANGQITTSVRTSFAALSSNTPVFIGSKGTAPNKHEGISGASWASFNSSSSPFWSGTAIDFDWYATNALSGETIDIISFQLGVNDSFVAAKTADEITAVVQNAKDLIDAFLAYNPSGEVVIILPSYSVNSADGWGYSYGANYKRNDYYTNIYNLQTELIEEFDEGAYNANVYVNIGGFCMDGTDGIDKNVAEDKNIRIPVQYEFYNQTLHPYATGGFQTIADGIFPTFLKLLQ